jgi:hypothetical protein
MKIEHGIPIPPEKAVPLEVTFPELLVLEVGDSFVIPNRKFPTYTEFALWGAKHGQHHEIRQIEGDFRVWRTL